jgi:hypothetical protein
MVLSATRSKGLTSGEWTASRKDRPRSAVGGDEYMSLFRTSLAVIYRVCTSEVTLVYEDDWYTPYSRS